MSLAFRIIGNENYHLDYNLNVTKFNRNLPDLEETDDKASRELGITRNNIYNVLDNNDGKFSNYIFSYV